MNSIQGKPLRQLNRALDEFFSIKAWTVPKSIEDFKMPDLLKRQLPLTEGRTLLMTDLGLKQLDVIVRALSDANLFDHDASKSDVRSVTFHVLTSCLSNGKRPDDGIELASMVSEAVRAAIDERTFAAPIFGVSLLGLSELPLGKFKIVAAGTSFLASNGVQFEEDVVSPTLREVAYWLVGTVRGTKDVAEQRFIAHAELLTGMLAISAASMYQHGAHAFRIVVAMTVQAHARSTWLSWSEKQKAATTHLKFLGKQSFEIGAGLLKQFDESGIHAAACAFFEAAERTPLQEAIARAVYWYSEAHRETIPTMKLVKYWSAVETFFSADHKEITKSVSSGLAAVLLFGGFEFIPVGEYGATKRRVAKLYAARSRAVHRGSHTHVSDLDAAELSQWVAWMLINMISLEMLGYTSVDRIRQEAKRLDAIQSADA
jgi:hypothetical protein